MIVAHLAQLALRHTIVKSLSALNAEASLEVLNAVNTGVQTWWSTAPRIYRQRTISHLIEAPRNVSGVSVTSGSNAVSAGAFNAGDFGRSVLLTGEAYDYPNRIAGTATLFNAYRGATQTAIATVYCDTVLFSDYSIERCFADPLLLDRNTRIPRLIRGANSMQFQRRGWVDSCDVFSGYSGSDLGRAMATIPNCYDIEPFPLSATAVAANHLGIRFYPLPTARSTLHLDLEVRPRRYVLTDLQDDTLLLPIADEYIDSQVFPLVEKEILSTTICNASRDTMKLILGKEGPALDAIRGLPANWGRPALGLGTKAGF